MVLLLHIADDGVGCWTRSTVVLFLYFADTCVPRGIYSDNSHQGKGRVDVFLDPVYPERRFAS